MDDLRYPVGKADIRPSYSPSERSGLIDSFSKTPAALRAALEGLDDAQLDTPYREGGWTVRQVAHHVPDSHLNGYIRMKLAITENEPVIKPYEQDTWVALPDSKLPVDVSLRLLEALHERWTTLLLSLSEEQWRHAFVHPELRAAANAGAGDADWKSAFASDAKGLVTMEQTLATYEWHGRHHTAHVTSLRRRMGW
jgi:hypothetical protein